MDATPCFQCGGDIPKGAYTMVISNTTTPPQPRRPGVACQCAIPQVLEGGAQIGLNVSPA